MMRLLKIPLFLLGSAVVLFTSYAFASSMDDPRLAGQGAGMVGGYTVTAIEYRLAEDPTRVQSIKLELDQIASTVLVKVISTSDEFQTCSSVSPTGWDCPLYNVDIALIDTIQVIALNQ
jgi:hypothetical protein